MNGFALNGLRTGRDDRLMSDSGREARHPYLDERLMAWLRGQPLARVCDLSLPAGLGDKRLLRRAARQLGLMRAAGLAKRAMQFGSRIANNKGVAFRRG